VKIELKGIVVIVGNYGSGKTEVSINLALQRKGDGLDVKIADLDLVNPYFRTREAKDILSESGIDVILPPENYLHSDLPILSPAVQGMLQKPSQFTLFDVGGNDVGATVLAALEKPFEGKTIQVLQVVNPFRPYTETITGCLKVKSEIEGASKLQITGFICNANLIDETSAADIYEGYRFAKALSEESSLKLEFITVSNELMKKVDVKKFDCPVLEIYRQLVFPWNRKKV